MTNPDHKVVVHRYRSAQPRLRQAFIWKRLIDFGQIRSREIVRKFGVTTQTAANDLRLFVRENPGVIERMTPYGPFQLTEEWQDAA